VLRDVPRVLGALLPFWWSRVLFRSDPEGSAAAALPSGF